MRKEFELTQNEFDKLVEASKPVAYMVIGGHAPSSPQENANRAWQTLADKKGFMWDTVRPNGKGNRFFTAEEQE